jgi:hypothetical protein
LFGDRKGAAAFLESIDPRQWRVDIMQPIPELEAIALFDPTDVIFSQRISCSVGCALSQNCARFLSRCIRNSKLMPLQQLSAPILSFGNAARMLVTAAPNSNAGPAPAT